MKLLGLAPEISTIFKPRKRRWGEGPGLEGNILNVGGKITGKTL